MGGWDGTCDASVPNIRSSGEASAVRLLVSVHPVMRGVATYDKEGEGEGKEGEGEDIVRRTGAPKLSLACTSAPCRMKSLAKSARPSWQASMSGVTWPAADWDSCVCWFKYAPYLHKKARETVA